MTEERAFTTAKIDASVVILGFTGSIGSGCSYISQMIMQVAAPTKKYRYYKISSVIRDALAEEGKTSPSVEELQDKGNQLRFENGPEYLVRMLFTRMEDEWEKEEDYGIVIDGIKNEAEVLFLKRIPNFYLFSIQADRETRCERTVSSGIFASGNDFLQADTRDQHEDYEYGQQVKRCDYLSDIVIFNNRQIPRAASADKERLVRSIYDRYVKLIENLRDGVQQHVRYPTVDELCMTIAYALSKSSHCIKRQVGAVIVNIDEASVTDRNQISAMPFIVSSGFNEVPVGSYPCIFHSVYQKCHRDYLQEEFARKLEHCPHCGRKIEATAHCPSCGREHDRFVKTCGNCSKEVEVTYTCQCGSNVFDEYLPGGKQSPGKLLDMCRSLHAEEISLLRLNKSTGKGGDNLVLYVTTQPCHLCANKIVVAGIDKVIYVEPYSMKEAMEILQTSGVTVERFEGVKSSAYFRLYQ